MAANGFTTSNWCLPRFPEGGSYCSKYNRTVGHFGGAQPLGASTCCWWATLAFIAAAPSLLGHRPARHPICETSIAIVRLGRSHAATALVRTTLAVDSATPLLLCPC